MRNIADRVRSRRAMYFAAAVTACLALACAVGAVLVERSRNGSGASLSPADAARGVAERLPLPWRPSPDEQFPPASECAECHPTEAAAWQMSSHARSAENPLVHASICGRCHAPLGTQLDGEYQLKLYDGTPMRGLPAAAAEGVTCITCHARTHLPEEQILTFLPVWPNWRTTDLALEILPFDEAVGTFGTGTAADPAPVANESHTSAADPGLQSAAFCQPCHDVVVDKSPLAPHCGLGQARVRLLTTYAEWSASPYSAEGRTCQSCHMADQGYGPAAVAPKGTKYDGPLPDRLLKDHTITGLSSDYLSSGPDVDRQEQRVAARVTGAATIALRVPPTVTLGTPIDAPVAAPGARAVAATGARAVPAAPGSPPTVTHVRPLQVTVTVTNTGAGHELPTGFAYWSEAWLEVTATDATGRVLFASGDVDGEGWLRDEFNPRVADGTLDYDAYLVSLRARLVSLGPNVAAWTEPDGSIRIPPDEVPRNLNGTPIIGLSYELAARILQEVRPGTRLPTTGIALQEGYVLRFADTIVRNGIPALASRVATYPVRLAPATQGPVRISARLLIRSQWPWMLKQQEELPTPRPRPRIYEIAGASASVSIVGP